jgi:hypothetical protein
MWNFFSTLKHNNNNNNRTHNHSIMYLDRVLSRPCKSSDLQVLGCEQNNKPKELASRFHEGTGKKDRLVAQGSFFDWFFDSFHNRCRGDGGGYKFLPQFK